MISVHITEAKFLLLEVSTTTMSPSIWHLKSVPINETKVLLLLNWVLVSDTMMSVDEIEAKFLLLEVCTTTSSPSIWHLKSVHITEARFLLWKVYYYIESQHLTPWCQYTWLRQSFYCRRSVLLHWVPVSDTWSKYTSLRPSFYC